LSGSIDETWRIPYFEGVVVGVLSTFLVERGFARRRTAGFDEVIFERFPTRLRVHYLPEEPRPYSPMVSIGFVPGFDHKLQGSMIGLWYAIPADDEGQDYSNWRFDSEAQLSAALQRIRDDLLDRFARPLWEDPQRLRGLLERQLGELKEERLARIFERDRAAAIRAFADGDYARTVELYSGLPERLLARSDAKRLAISKSRIG
jgi:hypothetical protein